MMLTSLPGVNNDGEGGYMLLRGLLIVFIILLCFASVLGGITIFSHRSAVLLEQVKREINTRNDVVKNLLK